MPRYRYLQVVFGLVVVLMSNCGGDAGKFTGIWGGSYKTSIPYFRERPASVWSIKGSFGTNDMDIHWLDGGCDFAANFTKKDEEATLVPGGSCNPDFPPIRFEWTEGTISLNGYMFIRGKGRLLDPLSTKVDWTVPPTVVMLAAGEIVDITLQGIRQK